MHVASTGINLGAGFSFIEGSFSLKLEGPSIAWTIRVNRLMQAPERHSVRRALKRKRSSRMAWRIIRYSITASCTQQEATTHGLVY